MYPLYRERWGLSVTMLTVVFAVYVVGLLGALLTVGSLSDHLGRRPVLAVALLVAAASTAIFWTADGVVSLLIARVVQGIATGTATGGLAAGLVELSPERRPHLGPTMTAVGTSIGMATGAGVVGLLVQSTSRPDAYVFPVLTLTFVVLAAVILTIPETLAPRAFRLASTPDDRALTGPPASRCARAGRARLTVNGPAAERAATSGIRGRAAPGMVWMAAPP
ncbi:MFS transporter [Streptomyces sp. NPDC001796]|uniref:MFS transporter n=1 Tax=Streptomyces sp. NPDC001796 TaxID=3364609 RepID=UPI00367587E3